MDQISGSNAGPKPTFLLYASAGIASLGGFLFGYDSSVVSGAILFIKKQFLLSRTMEEVIISSLFLSAAIGAPLGGILSDRIGRRKVLIASGIIFIIGDLGMALSPDVYWLIVSRFLAGLALGMVSVTSPLYISEISDANSRGWLVSLNAFGITFGAFASYLVDYAFSGFANWRLMFGCGAIPSTILAAGMIFLPETPRWLTKHSLFDEARSILIRSRGTVRVDQEIAAIRSSLGRQRATWTELFRPGVRAALLIGIGLAFLRSFTGFGVVLYGYAPTIFEYAGFRTASIAILATVGMGFVNMIMNLIALPIIHIVGRRPLLMIGFLGMAVSIGMLGVLFLFPVGGSLKGWIAVLSLVVFVSSFSLGPRALFWLLISEIYPLKIRGVAMSVGSSVNWITNWLVTLTFLSLIRLIGHSETLWIYSLSGFLAMLLVYFFVPETKGKSLEQIEEHFRSGKNPQKMGM